MHARIASFLAGGMDSFPYLNVSAYFSLALTRLSNWAKVIRSRQKHDVRYIRLAHTRWPSLDDTRPSLYKMKIQTRTARLLLSGYLGFVTYVDVASSLTRSGVANVPLGFSSYVLLGEVSILTHAIGLVLII